MESNAKHLRIFNAIFLNDEDGLDLDWWCFTFKDYKTLCNDRSTGTIRDSFTIQLQCKSTKFQSVYRIQVKKMSRTYFILILDWSINQLILKRIPMIGRIQFVILCKSHQLFMGKMVFFQATSWKPTILSFEAYFALGSRKFWFTKIKILKKFQLAEFFCVVCAIFYGVTKIGRKWVGSFRMWDLQLYQMQTTYNCIGRLVTWSVIIHDFWSLFRFLFDLMFLFSITILKSTNPNNGDITITTTTKNFAQHVIACE